MRLVMATLQKLTHVFRVVAFVEADMLMPTTGRLRPIDGGAIESRFEKLDVVGVGAAHFHAQSNATSVGEYRSLGTQLATIGRVFTGIFPRPEAIWSSLRPRFANSTECL